MNIKTLRSSKGWDSISIEMTENEIIKLIFLLDSLRSSKKEHFHIRNDAFQADFGVADIEFSKFECAGNEYILD
jgi:hypothetical protein